MNIDGRTVSVGKNANAMVDKKKYIERFRQTYHSKTGVWLSDDLALEYFEKLVALVGIITSHTTPKMVITDKHGGEEK